MAQVSRSYAVIGWRLAAIIICFSLLMSPSLLKASPSSIQNHQSILASSGQTRVVPILFVPKNLHADPLYTSAINEALVTISSWYAGQLAGRTFRYLPVQTVIGKHDLRYYCPKTTVDTQCIQVPGEIGADSGDIFTVADDLASQGYPIEENVVLLIFWVGGYGYAGGVQYSPTSGLAAVGDWALDGIAGKYEAGTATSRCSDSPFAAGTCRKSSQLGGVAHELGHAFGLPHPSDDNRSPDDPNFWLKSLMGAPGDFPRVTLIDSSTNPEKTKLRQHAFFQFISKANIQPILFIPSNVPTDVDYVKAINSALATIQTWYAGQLDGHTFSYVPVQIVVGRYELRHYCPKTLTDTQCIQKPGELGADAEDIQNVIADLTTQGYPLQKNSVLLIFWSGGYGYANAAQSSPNSGFAALADWTLDGLAGKYESGTATSHCADSASASILCKKNAQIGAVAQMLARSFGLPYSMNDNRQPDDPNYWLKSLMAISWEFPNVILLNSPANPEKATLLQHPFFRQFRLHLPMILR